MNLKNAHSWSLSIDFTASILVTTGASLQRELSNTHFEMAGITST
jgi:hypothetical protein